MREPRAFFNARIFPLIPIPITSPHKKSKEKTSTPEKKEVGMSVFSASTTHEKSKKNQSSPHKKKEAEKQEVLHQRIQDPKKVFC